MKKFGFFDQMDGDLARETLKRETSSTALPDESAIVSYLSHGTMVAAVAGPAIDLLSEDESLIDPPHIFTDGEWIWSGDVRHYVEKYHLRVPDEFKNRMSEVGWIPPKVVDIPSLREMYWEDAIAVD